MEAETVDVPVPKFISVPAELTAPCVIAARTVTDYGDVTDVALEALAALAACEERMQKIRELK